MNAVDQPENGKQDQIWKRKPLKWHRVAGMVLLAGAVAATALALGAVGWATHYKPRRDPPDDE
jgi:hypothetical protein